MLTRRTPLRARRPEWAAPRERVMVLPTTRPITPGVISAIDASAAPRSTPKECRLVSEAYRAAVRALPCYRCGVVGFTQFCHSDQGKGAGLKTDDRHGWPGCGPHPGPGGALVPGCHHEVGSTGALGKTGRRAFEAEAAAATRHTLRITGRWPAGVPQLPEEEHMQPTAPFTADAVVRLVAAARPDLQQPRLRIDSPTTAYFLAHREGRSICIALAAADTIWSAAGVAHAIVHRLGPVVPQEVRK